MPLSESYLHVNSRKNGGPSLPDIQEYLCETLVKLVAKLHHRTLAGHLVNNAAIKADVAGGHKRGFRC